MGSWWQRSPRSGRLPTGKRPSIQAQGLRTREINGVPMPVDEAQEPGEGAAGARSEVQKQGAWSSGVRGSETSLFQLWKTNSELAYDSHL
jgi:hypothetical protein